MHDHEPISADWFAEAFGALYPVVYAHRTVEAAEPEAAFAVAQLRLRSSDTVLDLCCGNGRHMVHLAPRVRRIIGLDYSAHLLRLARERLGPAALLLRGDMRTLPFREYFDAVANFFTSFGYFLDPEEDGAVARDIARVLKRGGRFFLDYLNPPYVASALLARSEREEAGYRIIEDRWIDARQRRVNKRTTVWQDGKVVAKTGESVRLYSKDELAALLGGAGLEIEAIFGDYAGTPLDDTQPRMIVAGHKE